MLENPRSPRVRAVAKLAKRRARNESGLFLLEGPQAVREALQFRPDSLDELYVTVDAWERHTDLHAPAAASTTRVTFANDAVLAAMADTVTPQGVLAVARQQHTRLEDAVQQGARLVAVCEQIRDPGNLGTIIRVADAAGADAVILTGDTVDQFNPKVVRATTGSLFHVPVVAVAELASALSYVASLGLRTLAADIKGDDLLALRRTGALATPTAWVFGNEARGLDDDALALADAAVRLPIYGRAESLNLATAASVCLYESAFALRE